MARCGCSGTSCSCAVEGSGSITVTGSGSGASPYVVSGGGEFGVTDTATVDLTLTGDGSSGTPYNLAAVATVDVEDLANLDTTGVAAGYTINYTGSGWDVIPAPSAAPGLIVTDTTLEGDGSGGNPLGITEQATGTYTPTWTGSTTNPGIGSGSLTGRYTKDPTSAWVDLSIEIVAAADTTKGSGAWSLTLPPGFDALGSRLQIIPLLMTYTNGLVRVGHALTNGGSDLLRLYVTDPTRPTGAAWIDGSLAASWGSGCRLAIQGRYEMEP